jgi:hypothetical protein
MRPALRLRQLVNAVNLSTLLGLALARIEGARLERGADGIVVARDAHGRFPRATAFTVGNVVIVRARQVTDELLAHETHHATQWACCVVWFLPLYLLAMLWSWAATGDHWSRNTFERRAGLRTGGYEEHPLRCRRGAGTRQPDRPA